MLWRWFRATELRAQWQRDQLCRNPHPGYVLHREGAGRGLYLPAFYVRMELGRIFAGSWSFAIKSVTPFVGYQTARARAIVRLRVKFADGSEQCFDGDGDGMEAIQDNAVQEAIAAARKSAVSDALKRAAINLGVAFGLGLYDGQRADWSTVQGPANGWPAVLVYPGGIGRPHRHQRPRGPNEARGRKAGVPADRRGVVTSGEASGVVPGAAESASRGGGDAEEDRQGGGGKP